MTIGIIGDLHLRENMSYADYIPDRRQNEKHGVLKTITTAFKDCDAVVMVGDQFHARNNPSSVNADFVDFLKSFNGKEVFVMAGNHEKFGDGTGALDFLVKMKNPKWHIITNSYETHYLDGKKIDFLPYFSNAELKAKNNSQGLDKVIKMLKAADVLFVHYGIAGTAFNGFPVDKLNEIVLPYDILSKKYKRIFAGHIHEASNKEKITVTGSVFTHDINEKYKSVWIYDLKTNKTKEVILPGVPIYGLVNPTPKEVAAIATPAIVKITLTDVALKKKINDLKKEMARFDAHILVEQYPHERKKIDLDGAMMDFGLEKLLEIYAMEKKIDIAKLKNALALIM